MCSDARHHVYLVKCHTCGWNETHAKAMLRAHRRARRHARIHRDHPTSVYDMTALETVGEYHVTPDHPTDQPLF